ncbi:MAG: hypothetical protein ACOH19_07970 [Rhodoglobus sp.]
MSESTAWSIAENAWGAHEPEPRSFEFGPWSWELRGDEVADVRFDGTLVLRMVRVVARDRNWNTVPTSVTALRSGETSVEIDLTMVGLGATISATLTIEVDAGLRLSVSGTSHAAFVRNRLGLVVLHPPGVAGAPLTVISPDGSRIDTAFPRHVSPRQPAFDIAALQWTADSIESTLSFEGEVFEMEDQRNWTDASFKTYSTPLALPFPVALPAGYEFSQTLELVSSRVAPAQAERSAPITLVAAGPVPEISVGASTAPGPGPSIPVPASTVLVELETAQTVWRDALARAARSGIPLDVRIVTSDPDDIDSVLDALGGIPVRRLGVFSADTRVAEPHLWARLESGVAARGLEVELVAGTRAHFTELNRSRERLIPSAHAVTFSVTPQMHARERSQLVESIAMQAVVARDAASIAGGRPVHVGPIALRARFNAVSTTPRTAGPATLDGGYGPHLDDSATDERQTSTAARAWTVASFAALAAAGVASACYFEEWGPRGLMDSDGAPYPVLDAIRQLHTLHGQTLLVPQQSGHDLFVLGALSDDTVTVLAANVSAEERFVEFESEFASGHLTVAPFDVTTITMPRE